MYQANKRMRTTLHIVGLTLLMVGCADSQLPEKEDAAMATIAVAPSLNTSQTKATFITEASQLGKLQIHAHRTGTHEHYFTAEATRNSESSLYAFNQPYYWLPGAPLDFYVITSSTQTSKVAVEADGLTFDFTAKDGADSDILAGCTFGLEYEDTDRGVVPVKLNHALSLVEFAVGYELDANGDKVAKIGKDIIITQLALKDLSTKAHCQVSANTASWSQFSAKVGMTQSLENGSSKGLTVGKDIYAGEPINLSDQSKAFVVIPGQPLATLEVSFIEGAIEPYTKEIPIEPILLQPGKHYLFYLSIKSSEVSVAKTSITDWVESGTTDVTLQ